MMKPYSRRSTERSAIRAMLANGGSGEDFFHTRAGPRLCPGGSEMAVPKRFERSKTRGRRSYADFDFHGGRGDSSCRRSGRSDTCVRHRPKLQTGYGATTGLSVDQSLKNCVNDENRAQRQLASQWSKFSASSKTQCIPLESIGGTPSYVSLLTCLQMNLWVR